MPAELAIDLGDSEQFHQTMMLAPREQVDRGVRSAQDRRSAARANSDSRRDRRRQQPLCVCAVRSRGARAGAVARCRGARRPRARAARGQREFPDRDRRFRKVRCAIRGEREAARTGRDARLLSARGQGGVHAPYLSAAGREERNWNFRRWYNRERRHSRRRGGRIAGVRISDARRDAHYRDSRVDGSARDRDGSGPSVDSDCRIRTRCEPVPPVCSPSTCAIICCSRPIISTRW